MNANNSNSSIPVDGLTKALANLNITTTAKQRKALEKSVAAMKQPSKSKKPAKRAAKNVVAAARASGMQDLVEIERILLAMSAPGDFLPIRLSRGWQAIQTALAHQFYKRPAEFTRLTTPGVVADTVAFVFRDAARAFVTPTVVNDFVYRGQINNFVATSVSTAGRFGPLVWLSGSKPHGGILYPGVLDGMRHEWYWVGGRSKSASRDVRVTNNTGASITVGLLMYFQGQVTQATQPFVVANGAFIGMLCSEDAYYAIDVTGSSTGAITLEIVDRVTTAAVEYAHLPLPFYSSNSADIESFQVYAASLMYTNNAAPINRQGKIAGFQVPRGRDWYDFRTYDSVAAMNDSKTFPADNGMYGYLKPSQPEDFNFKDRDLINTNAGINSIRDVWFPIVPDSGFLVMAVNITAAGGQDGQWTPWWAYQFRTSNTIFFTDVPEYTEAQIDVAMKLLSQLPQWHENPFHVSDIFDWLGDRAKEVYATAQKYLPQVVSGATTIAKIGSAIIPFL